jgi:hypothetical protein
MGNRGQRFAARMMSRSKPDKRDGSALPPTVRRRSIMLMGRLEPREC